MIVDNGKIKDEHNYFGMQELVVDGKNELNIIEPPIFDGGVSGYFVNNDDNIRRDDPPSAELPRLQTVKKYYAEYYNPIDEKGSEWQFVVQCKSNEKITLGFKNLENVPCKFRKILLDIDRNIIYDLAKQTEIQTTGGNGKRNFQILTGVDSYIELIKQKIQTKPMDFILYQNYPNPFNPITTIRYGLPVDGQIYVSIYDTYGRLVKQLVNEYKTAGYYEIIFDGSGLSSGVYYYRIICNNFIDTKRFVFVK